MDKKRWQNAAMRRDAMGWKPWSERDRELLVSYNTTVGLDDETGERIEILGDGATLAVVAGQQAGLFLSPLYIVYKALGATLLARRLEEALERPVLPLFWIASDDHDYEEVRHAPYLDGEGRQARVSLPELPPEAVGRSVFDLALDRDVVLGLLDEIDGATRDTEFKGARLDAWRDAALASSNLEDFFARLMTDALGAHCPILLPSRLAPLRERGASVVRRELESAGDSTRLAIEAVEEARARGGNPILHRRGNEVNVFVYRDGIRAKIEVEGEGMRIARPASGETMEETTRERLLDELGAHPGRFSPNVITRPVVQDAALPVVAQVVGPGEMNYLSLLDGVYDHFDVPSPERILRPRALLVEPGIERQMEKAGIDEALLAREDVEAIADAIRRGADPVGALDALDALDADIDAVFSRVAERFGDLAKRPAVESALEKTRKNVAKSTGQMRGRVEQEIDRDRARAGDVEGRMREALFPGGKPQERVYGPLAPFLTHYGPALIGFLARRLDPECGGLQVLRLSGMRREVSDA